MAFPTTPTTGANTLLSTTTSTASTTHTFPSLTTLAPAAGDLIIAVIVQYQGGTANAEFGTWGASLTETADLATVTALDQAIGVAHKVATGSESGTFTVTSAHTFKSVNFLMRIPSASWHGTAAPEVAAAVRATGAVANPGSLSPSWGAADTLWIAVGGHSETSTTGSPPTLDASPTNYSGSLIVVRAADAVGDITAGVAFYQNNAASEDAGTWTVTNAIRGNGIATTIAIRPAPTPANLVLQSADAVSTGDAAVNAPTRIPLQTAAAVSAIATPGRIWINTPAALYSGATIFEDTFTDTDGTGLNSHTSDSGATYSTHGAHPAGVKIDSNRAHGTDLSATYGHITSVSHSGDLDLQFKFWHHVQEAGAQVAVCFLYDPTVDSGYQFYLADIFGAGLTAVAGAGRYDSGVQAVQFFGDTLSPGGGLDKDPLDTETPIRVIRRGSLLTIFIRDVNYGSYVDSTYSSGRFGILAKGTEYRISDIVVSTVAGLTASGQSGAANLDLSAPSGGPVTLPLQTAAAVSTSTAALNAATRIALDPAAAVSTASGAVRAATQIPLQTPAAVSTSTAALVAKTTIPLGGAGAISGAANLSLAAGVIQAVVSEVAFVIPDTSAAFQTIPLQPAGAVSGATATLTAKPTIALQTADAVSTASASLTAKATLTLQTAAAVSTASASLLAKTTIPLQTADAVSTASAAFKAITVIPLQTAAAVSASSAAIQVGANTIPLQSADAVSTASATLKALTVIPLQTAAAVSAASASLKAISYVPLQTANAVSTATAFITVGAAVVPLQTAAAVSTATITLVTARTVIPLGTAAAVSTASAEVRTTGVIPLSTANAVSTASLTVRTTAAIPLQTAAAVSTASAHVVAPHMFVMPTEQPSFLALADRGPRLSLPQAVGALAVLGNSGRGQLGDATSILDLHGPDDTSELAEPHERIIIDG